MDMVPIDDIVPDVAPDVPRCPHPMIVDAIRNATIEFCANTGVWIYRHTPMNIISSISEYRLTVPSDAQVSRVGSAKISGNPIDIVTEDWLDDNIPDWESLRRDPRWVYLSSNNTVTLVGKPIVTKTMALKIRLSLKPNREAKNIPLSVYDHYFEQIGRGAKSKLMLMPGREWSDPVAGRINFDLFDKSRKKARNDVESGRGSSATMIKKRSFLTG